ncbi:MAG: NAD(P)/FAD-dependent oxidoreductase [Paracoccus sp. (in: a-proteobacteria)]|uniref:flavin-containing monooxygenase n=1 Tax=Paracoccus sp. TaxID=267 RepID=UPI0026E02047|nr:NAD(P)/FAD-dependent oxidoreductase [Paracoccus sp. (in: a-proteobacteria)]MDO5622956.1 NAD(P)/FAD-dependent oxidoreductase [Paracoccus sp. (in: a-proteobacteria)]
MAMEQPETGRIFDILILGAGMSGIGCAAYLRQHLPHKSWHILEMRTDVGGTWDLFRYPGIRSDSDLYSFAYDFRPWNSRKAIAEGPEIKAYIAATADDYAIRDQISFGRKVLACDWSSERGLWRVTVQAGAAQEIWQARWIFSATGYYDYDQGYQPDFPGEADFAGQIIHPQHWPEGLDYSGKRVAVIGSGATAVTLLPALAEKAAHVVQVQRSPTYIMPQPSEDRLARWLRPFLSPMRLHRLMRRKTHFERHLFWHLCQRFPQTMRRLIRWVNIRSLPRDYPVDLHFNPPYDPWDQRLCVVPDGDMFKALADGRAGIVTGQIARLTPSGIQMQDGQDIPADIIVTATGLNLKLAGGAAYSIDGQKVDWSERVIFRGMMLDGIPNLALCIGYTNASWTLKVGLICEYFCRLLAEMDAQGATICTAQRPAGGMALRPLLDFGAGYVRRAMDSLPKQGDAFPWEMGQDYHRDARLMRAGPAITPELRLERGVS